MRSTRVLSPLLESRKGSTEDIASVIRLGQTIKPWVTARGRIHGWTKFAPQRVSLIKKRRDPSSERLIPYYRTGRTRTHA